MANDFEQISVTQSDGSAFLNLSEVENRSWPGLCKIPKHVNIYALGWDYRASRLQ